MLCARSFRWFYLTFVVLSATALAQQDTSDQNTCDWYCWVEDRIDSLQDQIDKITKYLFPDQGNPDPKPPGSYQPSVSQKSVPSTFGTPYATTEPTQYATSSLAIVTVSSTAPGYPTNTNIAAEPKTDLEPRAGYRSLAYFGNWDIYARKFFPQQIPASQLTHLLYSFADNREDGTIYLTDTWADTDIHYAGDSWSDTGHNVYGAIKQLSLLKAQNRNLKVLLSVGGWTYTNEKKHLDTPASTPAGRSTFAASAVQLIKDYGFDGIDVDWEYPQNTEQGAQMVLLLKEVRRQMDEYADTLVYGMHDGRGCQDQKPHFLLSIAAPAGEKNYKNMPLGEIAKVVDFINLMAYDYAGSWDKTTGHTANLYPSLSNPLSTPFNTASVVSAYLSASVPPSKLNLGMPLYGRSFTSTTGLGKPYNGIGTGTWEAGVYDFKDMPLQGHKEYFDEEAGATWSYNNETGTLVSYDTVAMALRKTEYVKEKGLGGAMWWEVSGDKAGQGSIVRNVVASLGGSQGSGMEVVSNWLLYPDSKYDNIANSSSGYAKMRC
ncbi:glycoside hydrolase family 18 protein [Plenodomus tracheiphilus IPT5]|uniref:chitinase n=1 Tax=Plenodomus tracheiphilus IPT5 TaxID=1408161 RepID=A0A6A7B8V4_9PLEO|nr:glycoside hydrolase family 18 protein [Plenodomus tracheiphilus IPT5]